MPHRQILSRLLVITYHFPPDGSVGGLRWHGLSKYLARRGWEVHVLTASSQSIQLSEPGVHVHHVAQARTLNDRYKTWVARRRVEGAAAPGRKTEAGLALPPTGILGRIRQQAGAMLAYPDGGRGWILRAARAARAVLRRQRFDAVVSSGPPHSVHLAATLAHLGRSTTFYIDMRDPWRTPVDTSGERPRSDAGRPTFDKPWLERIILPRADAVIANTSDAADRLRELYPRLEVSFVPNGIDPERLPPRSPPSEKFSGISIAYAGTLYLGRDLFPVLQALSKLSQEYPEARQTLRLRIAGNMDTPHEARFQTQVEALNVHEMVEVYGPVSRTEALNLINRSHLALVLAQDQVLQVPAKLFECVAMGIPTLVIAEESSAADREARRIGAMACEPEDIDGIASTIQRIWQAPTAGSNPRVAIDYEAIADQMDGILRGLQRGAGAAEPAREWRADSLRP